MKKVAPIPPFKSLKPNLTFFISLTYLLPAYEFLKLSNSYEASNLRHSQLAFAYFLIYMFFFLMGIVVGLEKKEAAKFQKFNKKFVVSNFLFSVFSLVAIFFLYLGWILQISWSPILQLISFLCSFVGILLLSFDKWSPSREKKQNSETQGKSTWVNRPGSDILRFD
ncbi:MAG: hypothetical protein HGA61_04125 [Candidatus Moranbacteria bacterium]|nr:hypothetical protein [Candidatus Moranbacteria bacterium]